MTTILDLPAPGPDEQPSAKRRGRVWRSPRPTGIRRPWAQCAAPDASSAATARRAA